MAVWPLRVAAATAAVLLIAFVVSYLRQGYSHLWVHHDGSPGIAVVMDTGMNGTVYYTYTVGGTTYSGHSQKNWQDVRYRQAQVGEHSSVWYSSSHPWLSSLPQPSVGVDIGLLPLMLCFLLIGVFCGSFAIAPRSKLVAFRSRHTGRAG
jgi:Protein of unknown function (DUF3592)